jgi:hypothetical protein
MPFPDDLGPPRPTGFFEAMDDHPVRRPAPANADSDKVETAQIVARHFTAASAGGYRCNVPARVMWPESFRRATVRGNGVRHGHIILGLPAR